MRCVLSHLLLEAASEGGAYGSMEVQVVRPVHNLRLQLPWGQLPMVQQLQPMRALQQHKALHHVRGQLRGRRVDHQV